MTDGTASVLADALRDRYVLERELGRGGMATVYLAQDVKHARPTLALGGSAVLVVDDDGADCPSADFTSIQAAVAEAEPGSTILVCEGV